jgi:hypothetical protein
MNIRRRAVNGTTKFLDSWFGIESLFDKILPADEDKSEMSPDVLDDGMVVDEYIELDDGMIVDEYIEISP